MKCPKFVSIDADVHVHVEGIDKRIHTQMGQRFCGGLQQYILAAINTDKSDSILHTCLLVVYAKVLNERFKYNTI